MIWYLAPILAFVVFSCQENKPIPITTEFDPRIPGGNVNGYSVGLPVKNLNAVYNALTKDVTISWQNPPTYAFTPFDVYIFKKYCGGSGCTPPTPVPNTTSPLLLFKGISTQIVDNDRIFEGYTITYFVYTYKNNVFSNPISTTVTIPISGGSIDIKSGNFWSYEFENPLLPGWTWAQIGGVGYVDEKLVATSAFPLPSTTWTPAYNTQGLASKKGKIALAKGGAIMYIADTDNNRVLIYAKSGMLACYQQGFETTEELNMCLASYQNEPYALSQILGQPNVSSRYTCQTAMGQTHTGYGEDFVNNGTIGYKKCMTRPTAVAASGDTLVVVDSGNNRLLVYRGSRVRDACIKNINLSERLNNCVADAVIGQKGLNEISTYSVSSDGEAALNNPLDAEFFGNDLYIVDSGNNRVVVINNFSDTWLCNSGTWKTSQCSFSQVIGQKNLAQNISLYSEVAAGRVSFNDDGEVSYPSSFSHPYTRDFLMKYFYRPTAIKVTPQHIIVTSNEFFEKNTPDGLPPYADGRIMIFPKANYDIPESSSPLCNSSSFDASGSPCMAAKVFGQETQGKLYKTISGLPKQNINNYIGFSTSLEVVNGMIFVSFYSGATTNFIKVIKNYMSPSPIFVVINTQAAGSPNSAGAGYVSVISSPTAIFSLAYSGLTKSMFVMDGAYQESSGNIISSSKVREVGYFE